MKPDSDLHDHFAQLRRADHAAAPAWNPRWTQSAMLVPRERLSQLPLWRWAVGAMAAVALTGSALWLHRPVSQASPDLAQALPEFFNSSASEPLFADLGLTDTQPSDALLPLHLTIALP